MCITLRLMDLGDIPAVSELEQELFSSPWKQADFSRELQENEFAYYVVATEVQTEKVIGYAGMWILFEQAQITTIGVHREHQKKGIGQQLLTALIQQAEKKGCEMMSLEVRVSNISAQSLYQKNGFSQLSIRKGYYDDHEDAYLMAKALGGNYEDFSN